MSRILLCAVALTAAVSVSAQDHQRRLSSYKKLDASFRVAPSSTPQWIPVLSSQLALDGLAKLLIQSDGSFFPDPGTKPRAAVRIFLNGRPVGSESALDWSRTVNGGEMHHCFNALAGLVPDGGGPFTIELRALQDSNSAYWIDQTSNLSVFVNPSEVLMSGSTGQQMGPVDPQNDAGRMCNGRMSPSICPEVPTVGDPPPFAGRCQVHQRIWYNNLDRTNLVQLYPRPRHERVFMLASGWVEHDGSSSPTCGGTHGDAMMGMFVTGANGPMAPTPFLNAVHQSTYSVNDIWPGAELKAPVYLQGVTDVLPPTRTEITLAATDFPAPVCSVPAVYSPVRFNVSDSTTMVALHGTRVGGFANFGLGTTRACVENFCIGGNCSPNPCGCNFPACNNWTMDPYNCNPSCGAVNTPRLVASGLVEVPEDHDGIVFFATKARCQGGPCDDQITITLWIEVGGVPHGSVGVQKLGGKINDPGGLFATSVSQRTLCASWLSSGNGRLKPGVHTVEVFAMVTPAPGASIRHLAFWNDLPLVIWFG